MAWLKWSFKKMHSNEEPLWWLPQVSSFYTKKLASIPDSHSWHGSGTRDSHVFLTHDFQRRQRSSSSYPLMHLHAEDDRVVMMLTALIIMDHFPWRRSTLAYVPRICYFDDDTDADDGTWGASERIRHREEELERHYRHTKLSGDAMTTLHRLHNLWRRVFRYEYVWGDEDKFYQSLLSTKFTLCDFHVKVSCCRGRWHARGIHVYSKQVIYDPWNQWSHHILIFTTFDSSSFLFSR